jgi:hypothetical protein
MCSPADVPKMFYDDGTFKIVAKLFPIPFHFIPLVDFAKKNN